MKYIRTYFPTIRVQTVEEYIFEVYESKFAVVT